MKVRALILLAILAALAALAGCGGGGGHRSDEDVIKGKYAQMRDGFEHERLQEIMDVISQNYLDNGVTYDDLLYSTGRVLTELDNISVRHSFHFINVGGNYAEVSVTETMNATEHATGQPVQAVTDYDDIWRYERGDWFLYGNQRNTAVKKAIRWSPEARRANPAR